MLRRQALADKVGADERRSRERATGIEDERDRLAEIDAGLVDRLAIGVGAGALLGEGEVALLGVLARDGGRVE